MGDVVIATVSVTKSKTAAIELTSKFLRFSYCSQGRNKLIHGHVHFSYLHILLMLMQKNVKKHRNAFRQQLSQYLENLLMSYLCTLRWKQLGIGISQRHQNN